MIVGLLVLTTAANAQEKERKSPEERAKMQTERMTKELGLSPEQAARVEALNAKYAEEAEAYRAQMEAEREKRKQEGKARLEAHDADLKAVLTPEQYTQWMALREKQMERRKAEHQERKGDAK